MSDCDRVTALRLIVDNTGSPDRRKHLLNKAVQAYWRAHEGGPPGPQEDAALEFLLPLRAGCPKGLAQKAEILANMVERKRSAQEIAGFAASIADDALNVSRNYLSRAL